MLWGIFAGIVAISFLGYLGPGLSCRDNSRGTSGDPGVGSLFGENVSSLEFAQAKDFEMASFRFIDELTPELKKELEKRAWKRIVALRSAEKLGIAATAAEVDDYIVNEPEFMEKGRFSKLRFAAIAQHALKKSPEEYREYLRQQFTMRKLLASLETQAWVAPSDLQRTISDLSDRVRVEYVVVPREKTPKPSSLTEDDLPAYLKSHQEDFMVPEQARAAYVVFPVSNFLSTAAVSDSDIHEYYEDFIEQFTTVGPSNETVRTPINDVTNKIIAAIRARDSRAHMHDAAARFSVGLLPRHSKNPPTFNDAAAAQGLVVHTTGWFSARSPVPGLDVTLEFNKAAFELQPGDPRLDVSDAITDTNAAYVVRILEKRDSWIPDMKDISAQVRSAAESNAQERAFVNWCADVRKSINRSVSTGATFSAAVSEYKLPVSTTAVFEIYAGFTNIPEHAESVVGAIFGLSKGELSEPTPAGNNAIIAYVAQREQGDFMDEQSIKADVLKTSTEKLLTPLYLEWSERMMAEGGLTNFLAETEEDLASKGAQPPKRPATK